MSISGHLFASYAVRIRSKKRHVEGFGKLRASEESYRCLCTGLETIRAIEESVYKPLGSHKVHSVLEDGLETSGFNVFVQLDLDLVVAGPTSVLCPYLPLPSGMISLVTPDIGLCKYLICFWFDSGSW